MRECEPGGLFEEGLTLGPQLFSSVHRSLRLVVQVNRSGQQLDLSLEFTVTRAGCMPGRCQPLESGSGYKAALGEQGRASPWTHHALGHSLLFINLDVNGAHTVV